MGIVKLRTWAPTEIFVMGGKLKKVLHKEKKVPIRRNKTPHIEKKNKEKDAPYIDNFFPGVGRGRIFLPYLAAGLMHVELHYSTRLNTLYNHTFTTSLANMHHNTE